MLWVFIPFVVVACGTVWSLRCGLYGVVSCVAVLWWSSEGNHVQLTQERPTTPSRRPSQQSISPGETNHSVQTAR